MSGGVYRALLLAYPKRFRAEYGDLMLQLFVDQRRDAGRRVWLIVIPDLVRTIPTQRIEALMKSGTTSKILVLIAIVVVGTLGVIGIDGPGVIAVAAAATVGLVLTQRRRWAPARSRERAPLRHALVQAWWAPLAGLIGFALLVAAVGTVFEASNTGGRIFGTAALAAFGGLMLLGLVRRPFDRETGNTMILIATLPMFPFFWLVVPTLVGLVVWVGVLTSGFSHREAPAAL